MRDKTFSLLPENIIPYNLYSLEIVFEILAIIFNCINKSQNELLNNVAKSFNKNVYINNVDYSQLKNFVNLLTKATGKYNFLIKRTFKSIKEFYNYCMQKGFLEIKREVYKDESLSMNFQEIKIRAVLQLIADFTGLNIVTGDQVKGSVTLRLKNVPWDQALDIILKTKGLDKRQKGNVMLVAPTAELAAQEKLELEAQKQVTELAPIISETIQVNYAKAEELVTILEKKGNFGFDAQTEEYCDLVDRGIIDPTKVVRIALQDAASVAGILITTEAMVAERPEMKRAGPRSPGGGPDD